MPVHCALPSGAHTHAPALPFIVTNVQQVGRGFVHVSPKPPPGTHEHTSLTCRQLHGPLGTSGGLPLPLMAAGVALLAGGGSLAGARRRTGFAAHGGWLRARSATVCCAGRRRRIRRGGFRSGVRLRCRCTLRPCSAAFCAGRSSAAHRRAAEHVVFVELDPAARTRREPFGPIVAACGDERTGERHAQGPQPIRGRVGDS